MAWLVTIAGGNALLYVAGGTSTPAAGIDRDVRGSTAQASKVEKGSGIGMKRLRFSPSRGALRQVLDGEAGSGAAAGDQSTAAAKG
jgi:hypothetical protein